MSNRLIMPPTWRGVPFDYLIKKLGLATNCQVILDPGDDRSYTTGQSWLDRSGNGYDFFRGTTSSVQSIDPVFNGIAGQRRDQYWSFESAAYFTYDSAIETWMNELHQDNAALTFAGWFWIGSSAAARVLVSTIGGGTASTSTGISWQTDTSSRLVFFHGNAASTDTTITGALTYTVGSWHFLAVALNEATGANGGTFQIDAAQESFTSTYAAAAAGAASGNMNICSRGGVGAIGSNSRLGVLGMWNRRLTNAELMLLYRMTRHRYGV